MSLLLDALDRAERARREQRAMGQPELTLEAMGQEAQPAAFGSEPARLLSAPGPVDPTRRGRLLLLAVLLAGTAGIVGWLGWSLQSPPGAAVAPWPASRPAAAAPGHSGQGPGLPSEAPRPAATAGPDPTAHPANSRSPGLTVPSEAAVRTGTPGTAAAPSASAPASAVGRPLPPAAASGHLERRTAGGARSAGTVADAAFPVSPAGVNSAPGVDVRLFRSSDAPRIDPLLQSAWNELREGHLDAARRVYQQLEQRQPANLDVQLGLGRLAAEQGVPEEARRHYRRALELDPHNPTARAGLAVLAPTAGDHTLTSEIRSEAPGEPDAQLALASRLSASGQWPEAEQAWFEALNGRPGDPDLLYNLAIALDHLGQSATARRHYQEALDAMASRPAHFSRPQVEQRIQALDARAGAAR